MIIYGIGRNYADHAQELNNPVPSEPLVFLKAPSTLRGPERSQIAFDDFHFEGEVVLRIGDPTENGISAVDAFSLGFDLTRRDKQTELKNQGHPWTLAKSFRGAAIVGPWWPLPKNSEEITFQVFVESQLRQSGCTRDMIFSMSAIVDYLKTFTTLEKGDLIYTGTPSGVGPAQKGQSFELVWAEGDKSIRGTF